jgi:hypothetical protein
MHSSYNQAYSGILCLVWSSETCWSLCSQLSHMSAIQGKTCQVPWSLTASGNTIFCPGISLDFVEGLPTSHGFDCILLVVDLFSKYSHFVALKHPFTALSVAKQFMVHIYKLHGLPTAIVSDRNKVFTSSLWSCFALLEWSFGWVLPIIRNKTRIRKESINAWKCFYVVLLMQLPKWFD